MSKYQIVCNNSQEFNGDNGREACQFLFDNGCLPNVTKRPELTDRFNPLMMMQAAKDCQIYFNGQLLESKYQPNQTPKATTTPMSSTTPKANGNPADTIAAALQQMMNSATPQLDEAKVVELIKKYADNLPPSKVEIKVADLPAVTTDQHHSQFPKLLTLLANRINAMLVGEAGSGKSTAAKKAAEALNLPYYFLSVGATTTKYEFFGYTDANGKVVETNFRKAFVNGGVFLVDEFDAGSPNVAIAINEALANRRAAFPDGIFDAHPDFIVVAAANTYGNGATTEFKGRNALDKATLDRFFMLRFDIDPKFELSLATDKNWCKKVQSFRKAERELKLSHPITPRATFHGEKLLAAGFSEEEVIEGLIFKGLNTDAQKQLLARV